MCFGTHTAGSAPGFLGGSQKWPLENLPHQAEVAQEGTGKVGVQESSDLPKNVGHSGYHKKFSGRSPLLRAFTDTLVGFVNLQTSLGWDHVFPLPPDLKVQLREIKNLLDSWTGRPFASPIQQELHSDSSDLAWGGLDINTKKFVHEFWRTQSSQHINWKEMVAAISTVKSLATPQSHVKLSVDNTTVFYYLHKAGGRLPHYNVLLRPFFQWLMAKKIDLSLAWVPSADQQADDLSRWDYDVGDYTLHQKVFLWLQAQFWPWVDPQVDMFSSPGNHKLPLFVTRWPHFQAWAVDALVCPLDRPPLSRGGLGPPTVGYPHRVGGCLPITHGIWSAHGCIV
jgi:hypothetical protein